MAKTTAGLLADGDGQCNAWAKFIIDPFHVRGIIFAQKSYVEGSAKSDVGAE